MSEALLESDARSRSRAGLLSEVSFETKPGDRLVHVNDAGQGIFGEDSRDCPGEDIRDQLEAECSAAFEALLPESRSTAAPAALIPAGQCERGCRGSR